MNYNISKRLYAFTAALITALSFLTGCSNEKRGSVPSSNGNGNSGNTSTQMSNKVDYSDTEVYYYDTAVENIVEDSDSGVTYANNELILSADDSFSYSDAESLALSYSGEIVGYIEIVNHYQIKFSQTFSHDELLALCEEIALEEGIESAYTNTFQTMSVSGSKDVYDILPRYEPNDSMWNGHWDDGNDTNWGAKAIHADTAWGYKDLMTPIKIGLIDTNFAVTHDDLTFAARYENDSYTFTESHGTHVAGTMGADFDDGVGISGIYPFAAGNMYGVSVYGMRNSMNSAGLTGTVEMEYAVAKLLTNNVKVINVSMGFDNPTLISRLAQDTAYRNEVIKYIGMPIRDFLRKCLVKNFDFLIVAAAGNESNSGFGLLPSEYSSRFNLAKYIDETDTSIFPFCIMYPNGDLRFFAILIHLLSLQAYHTFV